MNYKDPILNCQLSIINYQSLVLGQVDFINCLPINLPIELGEVKVNAKTINAIPSKLNEMILKGELDIAPVSSYSYLKNKDKLTPIGDLCIASNGPADSVLLFSKLPIEELNNTHIALSQASATSNKLLQIILSKFYCLNNKFHLPPSPILSPTHFEAVLLIGDHALREFTHSSKNVFVYDLGVLWKQYTGLPMVFGMWVATKEIFKQYPNEVNIIAERLNQSKEIGLTTLFKNVVKRAQEKVLISNDFYELYFQHLSYKLTDECKSGLALFEDYALNLNLDLVKAMVY